jgi:hypothetical protein
MNNLGRRSQPLSHKRHHSTNQFSRCWERTVAPHFADGRRSNSYINPTFASVVFHQDEKKQSNLANFQTTNNRFYTPASKRLHAADLENQSQLSAQKSQISQRSQRSRYAEDFAHPGLHRSVAKTPKKGNFFTVNPEPTQAQAPARETITAIPKPTPTEAQVIAVDPRLKKEIVYMEQESEAAP